MDTEQRQKLALLLKDQEEMIKEAVLAIRGAEVQVAGQDPDDLFQILLEKYPKSVERFEMLYKRFSFLHKLQRSRLLHAPSFEEEKRRIMKQNRLFHRFYQRAIKRPLPAESTLGMGICLGVTLDLVAKKMAEKHPLIGPTVRGERLQQKYVDLRLASIERLRALYIELADVHFETPIRYFALYQMLCKKWVSTYQAIGGNRAKREFIKAKKIFETKKLKGNRGNLSLYKKFFKRVNTYALQLIDEMPINLADDLGFTIHPIFTNDKVSAETFIRTLKDFTKKCRKHRHMLLEFQNDIEKTHHVIYCSFAPPYEIQDANFPGFSFSSNDLTEFQLFFCFWSLFYDFSSFKALYQLRYSENSI